MKNSISSIALILYLACVVGSIESTFAKGESSADIAVLKSQFSALIRLLREPT